MRKYVDKFLDHWFLKWLVFYCLPSLFVAVAFGIQYSNWFALWLFATYSVVVFWECYLRNGEYMLDFRGFYDNIKNDITMKMSKK